MIKINFLKFIFQLKNIKLGYFLFCIILFKIMVRQIITVCHLLHMQSATSAVSEKVISRRTVTV